MTAFSAAGADLSALDVTEMGLTELSKSSNSSGGEPLDPVSQIELILDAMSAGASAGDALDSTGYAVLHHAVRWAVGASDKIQAAGRTLLEKALAAGCDPNVQAQLWPKQNSRTSGGSGRSTSLKHVGYTPLHLVASLATKPLVSTIATVVEMLCTNGANPKTTISGGKSPAQVGRVAPPSKYCPNYLSTRYSYFAFRQSLILAHGRAVTY